jgi:competence protein ComEC
MIRQILKKVELYPVGATFLALGTGIYMSHTVSPSVAQWSQVALILALGMVLITVRSGGKRVLWATTVLLFFVLGLHLGLKELTAGTGSHFSLEQRLISATVHKKPEASTERSIFLLKSGTNEDDCRSLPGIGRMSLRDCSIEVGHGDRILFRARIRKPRNRGNPGEFDWENHCANHGIRWQVSVSGKGSVLVTSRGSLVHPGALLYRIRERIGKFLKTHSQGDVRAILKGVVLGDRNKLTYKLMQSFVNSGLIHMLSASGLHVGFVVLLTMVAVRALTWPWPEIFLRVPLRKIGVAASAISMIIYCLLVGARVPTIRATVMGLVIVAAVLSDRPWRPLNSLAVAGLLILLVYPLSLFSPGFQLSFAAVAGILALVPYLMERLDKKTADLTRQDGIDGNQLFGQRFLRFSVKPVRFLAAVFLASLAAQVAVAPILLKTFHSFPVYSLFANMVAAPIFLLALPTALVASAIGTLFPTIGGVVLWPAGFLIKCVINVSDFFGNLKYGSVRISHMGTTDFILAAILAATLIHFLRKPTINKLGALSIATTSLIGFI